MHSTGREPDSFRLRRTADSISAQSNGSREYCDRLRKSFQDRWRSVEDERRIKGTSIEVSKESANFLGKVIPTFKIVGKSNGRTKQQEFRQQRADDILAARRPLGEYGPARIKSISAGNENIVNCRRSKEHKECELSELPRGCITYSKARAQVMRPIMESLSGA